MCVVCVDYLCYSHLPNQSVVIFALQVSTARKAREREKRERTNSCRKIEQAKGVDGEKWAPPWIITVLLSSIFDTLLEMASALTSSQTHTLIRGCPLGPVA